MDTTFFLEHYFENKTFMYLFLFLFFWEGDKTKGVFGYRLFCWKLIIPKQNFFKYVNSVMESFFNDNFV